MKNALKEKLNESLPEGLREKVVLKPRSSSKAWWLIPLPVALMAVVVYYNNQLPPRFTNPEAQEERIVDEFIQDMNEFDHELEDDMALYL